MPRYKYLIIGGGVAASAAVEGIREIDPQGAIGVISETTQPAYRQPALSQELRQDKPLDVIWRPADFPGVEFHHGRRAEQLDVEAHTVLDDAGETYTYDRLLLATGGTPRRLPVGSEHILYYRAPGDYDRLHEKVGAGQRFAVVGAGSLGSEIAAGLQASGKKVLLIFPEDGIADQIFPREVAQHLADYYRSKGVEVLAKREVLGIEERGPQLAVRTRHLTTGDEREDLVDGVVADLGLEPNVALAQAAGLAVEDGLLVDEQLRTNHRDVYAAGAVASYPIPNLGGRHRLEHEDDAQAMGRYAGRAMAGVVEPFDYVPYYASQLFDIHYEAVGVVHTRLPAVTYWKEPFKEGVTYFMWNGRVQGVLLWNIRDQVEEARCLIGERGPFEPEDLKLRVPWLQYKAPEEAATLFKEDTGDDFRV